MESLGILAANYADKASFMALLNSIPDIESYPKADSENINSEYPAVKTFRNIKFFDEKNLSSPKTVAFKRLIDSMTADEKIRLVEKVSTLLKAGYYKEYRLDAAMTLRMVVASQLPKDLSIRDLELAEAITKEKAAELHKLKAENKLTQEMLYSAAISGIDSEVLDKGKIPDLGPPSGSLSLGSVLLGALFPVTYFSTQELTKGSPGSDIYSEDNLPEALDYFEQSYLDQKLKVFIRKWETYKAIKESSNPTQKTESK
jgi:hypothetical protein